MFGLFGKPEKWSIKELEAVLLSKDDFNQLSKEKCEELLQKVIKMILKRVYAENYGKFNEIEKEMLEKMFDSFDTAIIDIEDYLKQKISKYDKNVKKALEDYYAESAEFNRNFGHIFKV